MTADLPPEVRLAQIRARVEAASPGPWEPGSVWLTAGAIYSETGDRVGPKQGVRCAYCHLGTPAWSGRQDINGTRMLAHRHRDPDPHEPDHQISAATGGLVAGNYGYEAGGILRREDTEFTAHARADVPWLLAELDRHVTANLEAAERAQREIDRLRNELAELETELDGRDAEARERWIQKQLAETGLKCMDFRNGMSMEIEPARDMVAQWVGAARAMLGDAPNYSETPVEMEVKVGESPERFAFILQRVALDALTPHEARRKAEAEREQIRAELEQAEALVRDLYDEDPCRFDHHGYCQAHGWTATEPACPHARARDLLEPLDGETEVRR